MTQIFALHGMTCENCVAKVLGALQPRYPGAVVTLNPPRLTIAGDVSIASVNELLQQAGDYSVTKAKIEQPPSVIETWLQTYRPLLLIVGYILGAALLAGQNLHDYMRYFMAGFFLVFSFFKFLDLDGFANSYARYDLLAGRWRPYAFAYPFIELMLGIAYLTNFAPVLTNVVTLLVMAFSAIGVINAVSRKEKIQCACLGTVLNLPMSSLTIIEDIGMAVMAVLMLMLYY